MKYEKPKIITYGKDEILEASANDDCSWQAPDLYSCGFSWAQCGVPADQGYDACFAHQGGPP